MTLQEEPAGRRRKSKREKKEEAFEIINEHARHRSCYLDKSILVVPVDQYQRDESDGRIAADIAMHFDLVAFGALLVIERATGELVVADGGTRLAGARKRPNMDKVLCDVFSGLTEKQEADVFLRVNLNRRKLRTEQQHHAELYSEDELALLTQQYLDMLRDARVSWNSLQAMRTLVKRNTSATDTIIRILAQVAVDKHVTARVMKGLVRLEALLQKEDKTLDRPIVIKKMHDRFGTLDAVVNVTAEPREQGDPNVMARAIARTLNIKFPRITK